MLHYFRGLIGAFLVFSLTYTVGVVSVALLDHQPHRVPELLAIGVLFGTPSVVALALAVGPVLIAIRRLSGGRLPVELAGLFGAAAGVGLVLLFWSAFREHDETLAGLVQFWRRVPGEFLVGVLPHAAASAFFCGWLASRQPRRHRAQLARPGVTG
jgi:hypothetical protein